MSDSEDDRLRAYERDAEADRRRAAIDKDVRTATEIVRLQEQVTGHGEMNKQRFDQIDGAVKEVKDDVRKVRVEVNERIDKHEIDEKADLKPHLEKLDTVRRLSWMGLMLILVLSALIPVALFIIDKTFNPAPSQAVQAK